MASSQFEKLENFRDVAQFINDYQSQSSLKPGLLFRSARPDEATKSDRELLTKQHRIKTIMDLRTTTEHINAAKKHSELAALAQPAIVPIPASVLIEPIKMSNMNYAEINLNGKGFERSLLWKLSYVNIAKVIAYMALGYRMEAIGIIGREVLLPRGLIGLGIDTLEHSKQEIKQVFEVLAKKDAWPVMIHCTQGKDRTGIIIFIILLLCGIHLDAITADYVKTESELAANIEERRKETSSIGLDDSFSKCPEDFPRRMLDHLQEHYGSVENYLRDLGVTEDQLQRVKSTLLNEQENRQDLS